MELVYSESKEQYAKNVYNTLCNTLDNMKWKYQRDDEQMMVNTTAIGEDLSIKLRIVVSAQRQVMYVKSPMPYNVPQMSRDAVGKALHIANFSMLNGCFEYDVDNGYVGFRMVVPFATSQISEEVCHYMIILTCQMVDKFNDKILSLAKGNMTLEEFAAAAKA